MHRCLSVVKIHPTPSIHITVPITQYDAKYSRLNTIQSVIFLFVVNRKPLYFMYNGILLLTAQPGH